jgi:hypothetical protein
MERMEGDVEKREVSTGGNGREAEAEKLIPGRRIIGTAEEGYVYKRQAAHWCFHDPYMQAFFPARLSLLLWSGHLLWSDPLLELLFRHKTQRQCGFFERCTLLMSFLGDLC